MKINLPVAPPADVKQGWEGQFEVFSWYNFVLNVPTNVFLVTTLKENGLSNVQLNAWGMLIGSGTEPKFILQVMKNADTLRLIERNREFVINLPSHDLRDRLLKAAEHFDAETDEIPAAGFTVERAGLVKAPRIRECSPITNASWTQDKARGGESGSQHARAGQRRRRGRGRRISR